MPASPDTPYEQALRAFHVLEAFVNAPVPPQPESPAPQWLTTPEGMAYMQAWSQGDIERSDQIYEEACTRVFQDLWDTSRVQMHPAPEEDNQ